MRLGSRSENCNGPPRREVKNGAVLRHLRRREHWQETAAGVAAGGLATPVSPVV